MANEHAEENETMKMIRAIRSKHYEETKDMSDEDKMSYYSVKSDKLINELKHKPHRVSFAGRKG